MIERDQAACSRCGTWQGVANVYSLGGQPVDPDQWLTTTGDLEDTVQVGTMCRACFEEIGTVVR